MLSDNEENVVMTVALSLPELVNNFSSLIYEVVV